MPQQVNLYSPILLAPRRHFSAAAMARALLVLLLGLGGLCAWLVLNGAQQARALQDLGRFQQAERQQLGQALAAQPGAATDAAALAQEVAREQQAVAALRVQQAGLQRGLVREGRSPAALLRLVAVTVPPPVWVSEVQIDDGQLVLRGHTLQPEALKPWLARLALHPLTAAQQLGVARVERVGPPAGAGAVPRWEFRIAGDQGTRATAATPPGGGAR